MSGPVAERTGIPRPVSGAFRYFVTHRTAANLLMMLMLVGGLVAGTQMRAQFFPDVTFDSPGAQPGAAFGTF